MNSRIQFTTPTRRLVIALMVLCFGLLPQAQAVSPPPDGGYPGNNTAEGTSALFSLTSGVANTALGFQALYYNTTSSYNTAEGFRALFSNTTGAQNTATGSSGLLSNTTGSFNTANGVNALYFNTTGTNNTASGARALFDNVGGIQNTAVGAQALYHNAGPGSNNTAVGFAAAYSNNYSHYAFDYSNTAVGAEALAGGDGGSFNTAIGASALAGVTTFGGGNYNTAVGFQALVNGNFSNNNIALGAFAGSNVYSAEHVICIDAAGANISDTAWIGSVYGVTTQSGTTAPVVVSDTGQLGTVASSERFKKDISTMERASEVIRALRPVTFHYRSDAKGTPQFGLIAEEVAKVSPALVLPDKEGKPYTVRYDAVNDMLLNEFLKAYRKVEQQAREMQEQQATIAELKSDAAKQEATISQLKKEMESVVACLKEHDSRIQKVSAQIELSKPWVQTALNNP
jgi:hypothetical protein